MLFTAPAFVGSPASVVKTDGRGDYNAYLFKNRNLHRLNNDGQVDPATGLGGMATEVRVYQGTLPVQSAANEFFA